MLNKITILANLGYLMVVHTSVMHFDIFSGFILNACSSLQLHCGQLQCQTCKYFQLNAFTVFPFYLAILYLFHPIGFSFSGAFSILLHFCLDLIVYAEYAEAFKCGTYQIVGVNLHRIKLKC